MLYNEPLFMKLICQVFTLVRGLFGFGVSEY